MTDEQSKPTICKDCKHPIGTEKIWLKWMCGVKSLNPVTDELRHVECAFKNTGDCPDYEAAALNHGLCAVCGQSPCACGTGHMGEVE